MKESFDQFVKEKRFLDNLAPQTIRSYDLAFQWFEKLGGEKEQNPDESLNCHSDSLNQLTAAKI